MEMYTMDEAEVVAELERAGGVVFDVREEDRCGPSIASLDYVVAKSAALEGASEPAADDIDPLATSVADALEAGHRQRVADTLAEIARLDGVRLDGSPRTRAALEMLRNRANLLGFALTSDRGAVGRASVVVRRVLRRLMVQVLHRQSEFNRAGAELIDSMLMELSATRKLVDAQREMIGSSEARIEQLERARSAASAGQAKLRQRLARAELRYAALRRSIIGANGTVARASSEAVPEAPDIDYLSLTNRFRGSTAEIRRRQEGYLRHFADVANVVDIGCGRGEFLQLLREHGVSATGVDVEESMVAECERLGLDAVLGDGIAYLESTPEASLGGIVAAQVIEHLSTNDLVRLVRVGFSRLRPGGVMLLETVNPTALITFSSFYADFTHNRPVHPQAVQWLAESAGFEAEIEYVSPVSDDRRLRSFGAPGVDPSAMAEFNRGIALANDLLFGYQEYALVARKPG
jgi:2-polyprenyl-3-methyl-5-hydroxy-6-metoxy-1,4-benzoquinol methylase